MLVAILTRKTSKSVCVRRHIGRRGPNVNDRNKSTQSYCKPSDRAGFPSGASRDQPPGFSLRRPAALSALEAISHSTPRFSRNVSARVGIFISEFKMHHKRRSAGNQRREEMAERWLTIAEMADRSNFSRSYFYTNRSLFKNGHKAARLPQMVGIGRNLRCRESLFEAWMEGLSPDDEAPTKKAS